jgi:carboxylate-amine ligase
VGDVAAELGSQQELAYVRRILDEGNGADRQLRVYTETNDFKAVVDYMVQETKSGLFESAGRNA